MVPKIIQQLCFGLQALRNERLSREQVRQLQRRKLSKMLHHAWSNSPFYRKKFQAAGIRPESIRSVADLAQLPPTTKEELRAAGEDHLLARGYSQDNTVLETTSGSSGKVLQIYHCPQAWENYHTLVFRHLWGIGYRPWHRLAYTSFDEAPTPPWVRLGLGALEQVDMNVQDPRRYLEDLLRVRPHVIMAFASILLLIIRSATPEELARIRPRAIYLHSELLTPGIRNTIRQAFGCDCFDDYSTFEFHQIASECRHHRYHVAADNVVLEFVRDGQPVAPGQEGEILITGLNNWAMPLIRYAVGDVGVASDEICPCGRGFPVMHMIQGRVDDFVVLPSGRALSPRTINPAFETLPGILEHVLVQEARDHVVVHLHLAPEHTETTPDLVRQAIQNLFQEPIRLEVKLTRDIERGRNGKLRCIVSKVKNDVCG